MNCNDCGGTLTVRGTQDNPDITCNHCDPTGPVDKTPLPNVTYLRLATIEVKVDRNWLTCDGEYPLDEECWQVLQGDITKAIQRIYRSQGAKFPKVPQIEWYEWDGEPEEAP